MLHTKILDSSGSLDLPPLPPGIDHILIADHQFPGDAGPLFPDEVRERIAAGWPAAEALEMLDSATLLAMTRHPGNQLAHYFSILPKLGLSEAELTDTQLSALAQTAAATDTHVEVNEKWGCPGPRAVAALHAAGATVVASTDSHDAGSVGRYERVREILSAAGAGA